MCRLSLPILPAVLLLVACGSPNDGTSQSESATVPAGEGAMTAPDMSSDTDHNNAGTTTGPAADGSMSGSMPSGPDDTTDPQSGSGPGTPSPHAGAPTADHTTEEAGRGKECESKGEYRRTTAYELRISDGSSDVCSSDLTTGPASPKARPCPPAKAR